MEIIKISTPFIKLDALLKYAGLSSTGGEAKLMITDGLVAVNGELCTERGRKIYPGYAVSMQGSTIKILADDKLS